MKLLGGSQRSSNFRYAMMAAQSLEKDPSIGARREDQRQVKSTLSELYCACSRSMSFGDLWVSLTTALPSSLVLPNLHRNQGTQATPARNQRHSSARKNSISEDLTENDQLRDQIMDSLAFSPLETIQLDSLRKPSGDVPIDWNDFFKRGFDHRRFFSFGLVHGLLVRVHNYPYFPGVFPEMNGFDETATQADSRQSLKNEFMEEKSYTISRSAAELMDGTRCDDELVCMFEKPFDQLVKLVEKFGNKKVVSVYATAPDA
jgi:hypothetical protein